MPVTVRYFAGARAAAGVAEEEFDVGTVTELLSAAAAAHGPQLTTVLAVCSILVDGVSDTTRAAALPTGCTVDVLPPFSGG